MSQSRSLGGRPTGAPSTDHVVPAMDFARGSILWVSRPEQTEPTRLAWMRWPIRSASPYSCVWLSR